MNRPFIFKTLLTIIFVIMLAPLIWASEIKKENEADRYPPQDVKKDKGKEKSSSKQKPIDKKAPDKPVIKEVPKARKQTRPPVVVKPNIKVKPKIIRPNIKKP